MGVDLDFGLIGQQPNFAGNFLQTYQAGRQVGLEKRADNALARVQTNPDDQAAFTDLALYAPDKANALLSMQATQRAAQARQAAGQVISAYGPQGGQAPLQQPQPAAAGVPAPQGQPGQPPQSPTALDPTHPAVQQVGAVASSGSPVQPSEAWAHLYSLDPELGDKMMTAVKGMDELRRAKLAETSDALAAAAVSLKSVPAAQRQAAAAAMLPQLQAHGVTPQMVQQADLSDQGLNGIIGQSLGAKGLIEQANKTRELGQKDQEIGIQGRQADTASFAAHSTAAYQQGELNKPQVVPFGSSMVRPSGQVVSDGMGGGAPQQNVIPLEQVWGQLAPGVKPTSGVRTPAQQQALIASGATHATNSAHLDGNAIDVPIVAGMTPQKITAAYAAQGVPVQVIQESGQGAGQGTGPHFHIQRVGGQQGGMMGALQAQAAQIATYRMPPPTGRAATSAQGVQLMQMVSQIDPDYDATKYHEKNASLLKFATGPQANTVRSINVAVDHLDQLQQAADALGNGNIRAFNGISNAFSAATGHPIPTNFDAIKNFVTDEVTKAIIGGGGGVGDREHAASIIARSNSPQQLSQAIGQIQGLMGGQLNGLERQYKGATGLDDFKQTWVSPRAQQVLAAHQPKQPPAGATQTATGPNGQKIALIGGKWVGY